MAGERGRRRESGEVRRREERAENKKGEHNNRDANTAGLVGIIIILERMKH